MKVIEFHEDIIFKNNGEIYGQDLIEIVKIKGKLIKLHQTESSIIQPKMYKPDLIMELEDRIIIFEFQSTCVNTKDKRRFRFYSALFDHVKIKSKKPIEVHVLSTVKKKKTTWYNVSSEACFPIYIHSLKNIDGDKLLNRMNAKIGTNQKLTTKDLLMISLLCFMKSENTVGNNILDSAVTITNIPDLDDDISQFVKGVLLMLCDKFVEDESLNKTISNIVGGNMKIVEDYAQRKVDESKESIVINLCEEGFKIADIARITDVSKDFVKKTLSK
ncbi:hypothetical protein [uncultured Methanobrevibacter sp.]|uniref:hypothetical protein n=1 Tax=uncultured Methanobrevibacter sp. TaxID=253161 RepID=UPI0025DD6704|nr:hypothetical protein [uncultured Methanobrevibacter sp.]